MRLIDVNTYEIRENFGDKIPRYAILSHTWGEEEVSFQDMNKLHAAGRKAFDGPDGLYFRESSKQGYEKIMYTCRQAREDGLGWAWVDTCCIDKTSSAELSEAINSMYQWYKESSGCYAYLSDVQEPLNPDSDSNMDKLLESSRWFTRGWTLQELIAPSQMKFFGQGWCFLGSRFDRRTIISKITRIPEDLTEDVLGYDETVYENRRYGILPARNLWHQHASVLYGEGERAFLRLQAEIFRETDDHSLLAWTVQEGKVECWWPGSVFANSLLNFLNSAKIVRLHEEIGAPSLVTKKGLQISLRLEEGSPLTSRIYRTYCPGQTFHAVLNCGEVSHGGSKETKRILLLVVKDDGNDRGIKQSHCYSRLLTSRHLGVQDLEHFQDPSSYETIFLRTYRHEFSKYPLGDLTQTPSPVIVHVHNIPFSCGQRGQDKATPAFSGYIVKEISYFTDGIAAYREDEFDPNNIVARGWSFILRMKLQSSTSLLPLEARCGFQRSGKRRDNVGLWLESKSEVRPSRIVQASHYARIEVVRGDLAKVSLHDKDIIMSMALRSEHSEDGTIHLHIDFSHQFASRLVSDQDHMELSRQTWRTADFVFLFQRSDYFLKQQELDRLEKERLEKERLENEMVERMNRPGRAKYRSHALCLLDGDGKPIYARKKRAKKI